MRDRTSRAWRMRTVGLVALLALPLAACDFEVVNPGQITEDALASPDAIPVILNGLIGDVEAGFDNITLHTGLASDELKFSGTRSWLGLMGNGDLRPTDVRDTWEPMSVARWTAVQGIERLTELGASADQIATAKLYAGFAHRIMGEVFCKAAFDGEAMMDRTEYFNRALAYFTAAESGSGNIGLAAKAGAAQTLLALGRYSDAAAKAASVPDALLWVSHYTDNDTSILWEETQNQTQASVWQTPIADLGPTGDPRVPFTIQNKKSAGGDPVYYRQDKYKVRSDDAPLAKGWEMRLIEAEALLRQGTPNVAGAMAKINYVRDHFGLAPKTAATVQEALAVLNSERLVTLWLEGRRMMDLYRFNDPFLNGRDYCFPFSDSEINSNPNLQGCSTAPECG